MIRFIDVQTHCNIYYSVIRISLFETWNIVHMLHVVVIDITYCNTTFGTLLNIYIYIRHKSHNKNHASPCNKYLERELCIKNRVIKLCRKKSHQQITIINFMIKRDKK